MCCTAWLKRGSFGVRADDDPQDGENVARVGTALGRLPKTVHAHGGRFGARGGTAGALRREGRGEGGVGHRGDGCV